MNLATIANLQGPAWSGFAYQTFASKPKRRKPGSDLVLVLISFRDGFRGSFARTVLAFAATFVS